MFSGDFDTYKNLKFCAGEKRSYVTQTNIDIVFTHLSKCFCYNFSPIDWRDQNLYEYNEG